MAYREIQWKSVGLYSELIIKCWSVPCQWRTVGYSAGQCHVQERSVGYSGSHQDCTVAYNGAQCWSGPCTVLYSGGTLEVSKTVQCCTMGNSAGQDPV